VRFQILLLGSNLLEKIFSGLLYLYICIMQLVCKKLNNNFIIVIVFVLCLLGGCQAGKGSVWMPEKCQKRQTQHSFFCPFGSPKIVGKKLISYFLIYMYKNLKYMYI